MRGCNVLLNYTYDDFIDFINNFGICIDFLSENERCGTKNPIFAGKVVRVFESIRRGKYENRPYDTLVVTAKNLLDQSSDKEFRIVFFGDIVRPLLDASIESGCLIGLLKPLYYVSNNIPSLVVGPKEPVAWLGISPRENVIQGLVGRTEDVEKSCSCCSNCHSPSPDYSNDCCRTSSYAHEHSQNKSAPKSCEELVEQQPYHANDNEQHGHFTIDPSYETDKRTLEWVQKWTPQTPPPSSLVHSPTHKSSILHSNPRQKPLRSWNVNSAISSAPTVSENSPIGRDKERKISCAVQKDFNSNKCFLTQLAHNNSLSTDIYSEHGLQIEDNNALPQPLLEKFKNKEQPEKADNLTNKPMLSNLQENLTIADKSIADSNIIVVESIPFNSEPAGFSGSINSRLQLSSSGALEKPIIIKSTKGNKNSEEIGSHQECKMSRESETFHAAKSKDFPSNKEKDTDTGKEGDLSNAVENKNLYEKTDIISASAMDIECEFSNSNKNKGVSKSIKNTIYLEKTLDIEGCHRVQKSKFSKTENSSKETFPDLKIGFSSDEKLSSGYMCISTSRNCQEINAQVLKPGLRNNENYGYEKPQETLDVIDEKARNRSNCPEIVESLSLADHHKINSSVSNKREAHQIMTESHNKSDMNDKNTKSIDVLVFDSNLSKNIRKRKRREGSASGSESTKSNEKNDSGKASTSASNERADSESSPSIFFDAQSNLSEKSNTPDPEKWCVKPLSELNLHPHQAFLKMLPSFSKTTSYELRLFEEFKVPGILIDIVPKVLENHFSIVKGLCNGGCQKSYVHDDFTCMEQILFTCAFCPYHSHRLCPECFRKGKRKPLCMYFSFKLFICDGKNVLRIEVEHNDAVTFLAFFRGYEVSVSLFHAMHVDSYPEGRQSGFIYLCT